MFLFVIFFFKICLKKKQFWTSLISQFNKGFPSFPFSTYKFDLFSCSVMQSQQFAKTVLNTKHAFAVL